MQLNRTERMLLETAAEMFCLTWSATQAAMLTEIELTGAEKQRWNGTRPQLGELLIARGELTDEMLDQVLNAVYGDVQLWSDRLASPKPQPVPKPPEATLASAGAQSELAELVTQLTGLLDLLVGGERASLENRSTRRVARPQRRVDTVMPTPPLQRAPVEARSESDDDPPTIDYKVPPQAVSAASGPADDEDSLVDCSLPPRRVADDDDPDSPTVHLEREVREEDRPHTLQVERAAETQLDELDELDELDALAAATQLDELDERAAATQLDTLFEEGGTLHMERPVETSVEGETIHIERLPTPTEDGPTLQVERPPPKEDTLQLERTAVAGDTVQLERELSDA